jgi:hypothetical protein
LIIKKTINYLLVPDHSFFAFKMDVEIFSETLANLYQTAQHHTPEQSDSSWSLFTSSRQMFPDFFVAAIWCQIAEPSSGWRGAYVAVLA